MRKWVLTAVLMALPVICLGSEAEPARFDFDFGLRAGYRVDELDWNIAGTAGGTDPDVLSELEWSDLEIYQVGSSVRMALGRPGGRGFAHGQALLDYGWIVDGENRDSDYNGDGRTLEWSRSLNDAGDGEVYDLSIGGGPGFRLGSGRLTLIPLAGYSYHRQNLVIRDGYQVIPSSSAGPFAGLDSRYEAEWRGPWAGLEVRWRPVARLGLFGAFAYHRVDFEASARWNLRSELAQPVSFTHEADGTGTDLQAGAEFELSHEWRLSLEGRYRNWQTDSGVDRIYLAAGGFSDTRLNGVDWDSAAVMFAVGRRF